jgi:hypothetical protein
MLPASSRQSAGTKKQVTSYRPASTNKLDEQHHESDDQQDVDVPSNHMEPDKPHQPKHQQNQENCPKHCLLSSLQSLATLNFGALVTKLVAVL